MRSAISILCKCLNCAEHIHRMTAQSSEVSGKKVSMRDIHVFLSIMCIILHILGTVYSAIQLYKSHEEKK